jgi:hypothetical protein
LPTKREFHATLQKLRGTAHHPPAR